MSLFFVALIKFQIVTKFVTIDNSLVDLCNQYVTNNNNLRKSCTKRQRIYLIMYKKYTKITFKKGYRNLTFVTF